MTLICLDCWLYVSYLLKLEREGLAESLHAHVFGHISAGMPEAMGKVLANVSNNTSRAAGYMRPHVVAK